MHPLPDAALHGIPVQNRVVVHPLPDAALHAIPMQNRVDSSLSGVSFVLLIILLSRCCNLMIDPRVIPGVQGAAQSSLSSSLTLLPPPPAGSIVCSNPGILQAQQLHSRLAGVCCFLGFDNLLFLVPVRSAPSSASTSSGMLRVVEDSREQALSQSEFENSLCCACNCRCSHVWF